MASSRKILPKRMFNNIIQTPEKQLFNFKNRKIMKKMFIVAAMFVAATMVACCGNQNAKECDKECCEKTECCEQKAECKGECEKGECCEQKAECTGECKGECEKAEAPVEAPAEEAAPEAEVK